MIELKCPFCQQELETVLQLAGAGGLVEEAYLLCSKCNIRGERKLWQELIDIKKKLDRYEKALEKIAKNRKIISMTGYDFDNEIYVNAAREALGLPLDIPEYDNVE